MSDFDHIEDEWWIDNPKKYTTFLEVPSKTKWLARPVTGGPPDSPAYLEVYVDDKKFLLPENYIAPLMVLTIQELSCMAESFSSTATPRQDVRLWCNIHFIWSLRECVLLSFEEGTRKTWTGLHPLLKRWIIRLIHGKQNSKSKRREHATEIHTLYSAYSEEDLGKGKLLLSIWA
jgi:hypothetical protein